MSDDELFDMYLEEDEPILTSLRKIYNQGRTDELAKIKEMFKMYQRLELKFTLNQCKEKDGLYYLDATELFNGLVDQVIDSEE